MSVEVEKREIELAVTFTEYTGEKQPLFMRSIRAEGQIEDGTNRKIEVAVNELGAGIIIRVGERTFLVSEYGLVDAILNFVDDQ